MSRTEYVHTFKLEGSEFAEHFQGITELIMSTKPTEEELLRLATCPEFQETLKRLMDRKNPGPKTCIGCIDVKLFLLLLDNGQLEGLFVGGKCQKE